MESESSHHATSSTGRQTAACEQTQQWASVVRHRGGRLGVADFEPTGQPKRNWGTDPRPSSLTLPPIDRLTPGPARPDALTEFVRSRTRSWGDVPVALSAGVVGALWTLLALDLGFGGWLLAVRTGSVSCSGFLCWAATLGDHRGTTFVLSIVCAGALAISVPVTRGLSRASGPQLALLVVGMLAGVLALAGLLAVLAATALALVLAFGIVVAVVDRV